MCYRLVMSETVCINTAWHMLSIVLHLLTWYFVGYDNERSTRSNEWDSLLVKSMCRWLSTPQILVPLWSNSGERCTGCGKAGPLNYRKKQNQDVRVREICDESVLLGSPPASWWSLVELPQRSVWESKHPSKDRRYASTCIYYTSILS